MQTYEIDVNRHRIQIAYSLWTGREIITHDGTVISEKRSYRLVTPHMFVAQEEVQNASYDVRFGGFIGYVVRRDGLVVAERHRGFLRYFTALGLLIILFNFVELFLYIGSSVAPSIFSPVQKAWAYWYWLIALVGAMPLSWWWRTFLRGHDLSCQAAQSATTAVR